MCKWNNVWFAVSTHKFLCSSVFIYQQVVHKRMLIYNLRRFVYNLEASNECLNVAFNIRRLEPSKVCSNPVH